MPEWHRRLQNVVILSRDAFAILPKFEDVAATAIYVDPPYVQDGKTRTGVKSRGDKSHTYLHDFAPPRGGGLFERSECQHIRLRDILKAYKQARIVVSYYDCDYIRDLYDGWTFIKHTRHKNLHVQAGRGSGQVRQAPEVLIINGAEYQ